MNKLEQYFREETFPTPFCPGCGHGILMHSIIQAIDDLSRQGGIDWDKCVFVSGIGCAAWIPSPHYAADTMHTTHGRPVAFATGIKLFNPKLNVIVISGDGDLASIGGNHLIHAARRNISIPVICANNNIYGMTGGQFASTTPVGSKTSTTSDGSIEPPFDLVKLVIGAGATYVARSSVSQPLVLKNNLKTALTHSCIEGKGFAFVDVISPCYTQFGRRNPPKAGRSNIGMIKDLKDKIVRAETPEQLSNPDTLCRDKLVVGEYRSV